MAWVALADGDDGHAGNPFFEKTRTTKCAATTSNLVVFFYFAMRVIGSTCLSRLYMDAIYAWTHRPLIIRSLDL